MFQRLKKVDLHIDELERQVQEKVTLAAWKEKKKKHKKLQSSAVFQLKDQHEARLKELERRLFEISFQAQEKSEDIEKKTLWRLGELESHLQLKIN